MELGTNGKQEQKKLDIKHFSVEVLNQITNQTEF